MGLLEGHRALVTGGGSGIGRAACRRMTEEGARVAVVDVDEESAKAVAAEIGGVAYGVDVGNIDAFRDAVDTAANELGGLSVIYNNAGTSAFNRLHELDLSEWDRVLRVNLTGVWAGIRAAVPHLLANGGGSIVSTASISGTRPAAGEGPYAASKAAVAALTASAALEYGPAIRVNAVSPGMIRTTMTAPWFQYMPDQEERFVKGTPVGRVGEPEDIADVVVFLCSDLARFITGQNIVVDGGLTLHGSGVDTIFDRVFPNG
jgi:meso-butanediol dehydrogenase / (S,S)-butanediol dehydrogenase / diacetyl reductase